MLAACHTSYEKARADSGVHLQLAREYLDAGDTEKAMAEADLSLKSYPKNTDASLFKAEIYAKTGRFAEAEKTIEEAARDLPEKENYKKDSLSAMVNIQKGDYARAVEQLNRSVAANPQFTNNYALLGQALTKAGEPEKALDPLAKWTELEPKSDMAWSQLGIAAVGAKQFDRAKQALDKALEINPKSALTYNYLGTLAQEQNNPGEAEKLYARSIALDDKLGYTHLNMGQLLMLGNRTKEAHPFLMKAQALLPGNKFVFYWLGKHHSLLDRPASAYENFEKALSVDPAFWAARSGMAEAFMRSAAEFERVEKVLREGVAVDPANAKGYYYYLARVGLKAKNAPAALEYADKAGALLEKTDLPAVADHHLLRGDILAAMGKPAEAKKEFQLAAAGPPGSDIAQQAKKRLGK